MDKERCKYVSNFDRKADEMERQSLAQAFDYWRFSSSREDVANEGIWRLAYKDTVYINFDSNSMMADLFSYDLKVERLIMGIELFTAS